MEDHMALSAPPLYVIRGHNLLEATLVNIPDIIDFGPHGPQITSSQFVGVRFVGSGIVVVESPKPSSHHHGLSDIFKGILGSRKASPEKDLSLSSADISRTNSNPSESLQQDHSDRVSGDMKRSKTTGNLLNDGATLHIDHHQNQGGREAEHLREEFWKPRCSPETNDFDSDLHTWELVWKEGKAAGSLKRLKFVTTDSGYQLIQNKLDAWASASHTSMAMNQAAKAALDACGGQLKENPVHQQEPVTDNFVPADHSEDDVVGHNDPRVTTFEVVSASGVDAMEEEMRSHMQYVIDMQSIHLQGKIHPHHDRPSSILKDGHIMAIAAVLPVRFRSYNWTLLYSTDRDGISLNTLYRKVHMNGPTILIVRDFHQRIFGCYASEEWKVTGRSYGTGECFVFQVVPDMKAYKWTRTNNMFMFSNLDVIAIGGGDHYSILLNSDLLTGYSGACETFGSPPLASSEEFDVSTVEVWGFQ